MYMYDHFLLNISQLVMMNLKVSLQYLKLIRLVLCAQNPYIYFSDCRMSGSERYIGQPAWGRDGPPSHAPHPRSVHGGLSLILFYRYMTNIGIKCKLQ